MKEGRSDSRIFQHTFFRMNKLTTLFLGTVLSSSMLPGWTAAPPKPYGAVPTPAQINWQRMEFYGFIHFGLNTFTGREWGYGDEDPKIFNPTDFNASDIVSTFKKGGMKGMIYTAKHHDGFCAWPTKSTDHNITKSPWKNGKGDVVREFALACKKHGIKFGTYLSPWDRNNADYGKDGYLDVYYKQIRELLTNYGPVFEIWFDGANGGDGWYGGAKDARTIDRKTYYDYPRAYKMIDELQPQAVIFSDGGPGCRWVGNENGFAGATNWSFLRAGEVYPGYPKYRELQYGHADGNQWVAAECDVSIRPGWFYHPEEDDKVKTVDQLTDLYYRSVGHNATLLLNFPVDRNGLIHPTDSLNAVSFHLRVQKELADNLLSSAKVSASDERGGQFKVRAVTDGKYDTYWATNDGVTTADLTFTFSQPTKMNRVMIQEYIPLGQRVKSFVVEYKKGDQWLSVKCNEETTTVGYKRLLRFEMIETEELRIRFTDARACLCINEVGAYYAPDATENYTPATSELKSFPFTILGVDMEEAKKCSDKDDQTAALISGKEIMIDLGENRTIHSFYYLPDQSEYSKGLISSYELSAGITEEAMQVVAQGEFSNIRNNPILQNMYFSPVEARYFKLKATRMVDESDSLGIAEIGCR